MKRQIAPGVWRDEGPAKPADSFLRFIFGVEHSFHTRREDNTPWGYGLGHETMAQKDQIKRVKDE